MKYKILLSISILLAVINTGYGAERSSRESFPSLNEAVAYHIANYQEGRLIDIYKSFFQDRFGPGHLKTHVAGTKAGIDYELKQIAESGAGGPDYEPAGLGDNFVRVNIGAIYDGRIPEEEYLEAFMESLEKIENPDEKEWELQWSDIENIINEKGVEFKNQNEDLDAIHKVIANKSYRMDHSKDYNKAYNFHYRIIYKPVFEKKLKRYLQR